MEFCFDQYFALINLNFWYRRKFSIPTNVIVLGLNVLVLIAALAYCAADDNWLSEIESEISALFPYLFEPKTVTTTVTDTTTKDFLATVTDTIISDFSTTTTATVTDTLISDFTTATTATVTDIITKDFSTTTTATVTDTTTTVGATTPIPSEVCAVDFFAGVLTLTGLHHMYKILHSPTNTAG